jgi:hypothetical protein
MKFNWRYYGAAAFLVGAVMIREGAPLIPVAAGLAATALLALMRMRRA